MILYKRISYSDQSHIYKLKKILKKLKQLQNATITPNIYIIYYIYVCNWKIQKPADIRKNNNKTLWLLVVSNKMESDSKNSFKNIKN